jgi:aarF domain-containing kinase
MAKIPTSVFSRGSKLMGLASKMAVQEISSRLKTWEDEKEKLKSKVEMAQELVKVLSQLKGASMKLGQLMSLDLAEYLPPEILKVLEQLHQQSTFLPFGKIEPILKEELKDKYQDLSEISTRPIAAASIGQVHTARLHDKKVVIKVQYPGVAKSIPSDLQLLEMIVKQFNFFQGKEADLTPLFQEVKEVLQKETDYLHEARMHALYKRKFANSAYIIPEVYPEYSTVRVITQEYIEGQSFSQWLQHDHPEQTRLRLADELMKLYLTEFFQHGLVQTDPNPGNFLLTSGDRIALLDFGAVKEYPPEFQAGYRNVLLASFNGDDDTVLKESLRLGFLDAREGPEVQEVYLRMMNFLAKPFRSEEAFNFADEGFYQQSRKLSWELTRKCRFSPPPKDLIFLHRKLLGVFVLIRKLGVSIRLKDYWHYVENA